MIGIDGVGCNMNAVDDDFSGPEGVTDAGKAWLSRLRSRWASLSPIM